jgi:hypothetical protein
MKVDNLPKKNYLLMESDRHHLFADRYWLPLRGDSSHVRNSTSREP